MRRGTRTSMSLTKKLVLGMLLVTMVPLGAILFLSGQAIVASNALLGVLIATLAAVVALSLWLARHANQQLERCVAERTSQLITEIAERARAVKELLDLHRRDALVLKSVAEGIHALDLEGRIIFENPAAERMFGWEPGELLGKPAHMTIHHSRAGGAPYPQGECPIYASLRDGISRRITDEVFWRKDGSSFPVEYVSAPVRDENHEIIGAVVVFSDTTETKRTERELRHAKEAAESANMAKSQFLANMSHEIRTPMNGVIGMTDLLLDGRLDVQQRDYAETIRQSAKALLTVLNDILDFSKIEAGKLEFDVARVDLRELVEDVVRLISIQAHPKNLEVA